MRSESIAISLSCGCIVVRRITWVVSGAFKVTREHPLFADLIQAAVVFVVAVAVAIVVMIVVVMVVVVVEDVQRPPELLLQALTTCHVTRVAQVSCRIKRFLNAEQPVMFSRNVPSFGLFGQIASMTNRSNVVIIIKFNRKPKTMKKKAHCNVSHLVAMLYS